MSIRPYIPLVVLRSPREAAGISMRQFLLVFLAAALCVGCAQTKETKQYPVDHKQGTSRPTVQRTPVSGDAQGTVHRRVTPATTQAPVAQAPVVRAPAQVTAQSNPPRAIAPQTPRIAQPLDPAMYRLAPGDAIRVDVFGEPELSLATAIESSGSINYPLLGRVEAAGMTVRQLESRIASGLRGDYLVKPDVRVSIAQYRPIFVTGQVRRVGSFPYVIGLTVERALAMAGGITEYGSSNKIYLQRENASENAREHVDLDQPVFPGDTLLVEERLF
jgi:polysaccharide export outer membrane protein